MIKSKFSFRPATRGDISKLYAWLSQPHVMKWWGHADEQIKDIAYQNEQDDAEGFIIVENEKDIGYIQFWLPILCKDEPWQENMPASFKAIDIFIAESEIGKGASIIQQFSQKLFEDKTQRVIFDPDCDNHSAVKAALKAGFTIYDSYKNQERSSYLMFLDNPLTGQNE